MTRHTRIQNPNLIRHVMSRGNGRMQIFLDDADYWTFLRMLGDVVVSFDVECWDYCIMPNHYHLTLGPTKANISRAMAHLNGDYAMWWNAAHSRVGHVFQGRFKDQIVQREGYLLALFRYLARNPVRAGLVAHPEQWPWSSYRAIAGLCRNPGFLSDERVLEQFGAVDAAQLRERYVTHVTGVHPEADEIACRLRSMERVIGDPKFKVDLLRERETEPNADREMESGQIDEPDPETHPLLI